MRDFKLWSYAKTAEVAEHLEKEITPLKNPDKGLLQKMHEVVSKCLRHYEPLERDLNLCGVYLFSCSEQKTDAGKYSFARTTAVEGRDAVIALSQELLTMTRAGFPEIVLYHELAHLSFPSGHGELFQLRLNQVMYDAYGRPESRCDSVQTQRLFHTLSVFNW